MPNTLRPKKHSYFADSIFKLIFFYIICYILMAIFLRLVPKGTINNEPALVQVMFLCQTDSKPLCEPVKALLICCVYEISHSLSELTHWGRVTHICICNLTIIGSDNGLSPGRCQAITWTNVGIVLIGPLGTNFSEMLIEIHTFSFKKIHLKMSSGKWRPFCLGLNVLKYIIMWQLILVTVFESCQQ